MTKKEMFISAIEKLGYKEGCIDPMIEKLSKAAIKELIAHIPYASTDVDVKIRGRLHVVEIVVVDDESERREVDIMILTQDEYISRYGDERWDND